MNLVYGVKDKPKFGQTIVFALQQLLAILAATIAVPSIVGNGMSQSAALFGAGVGTLVYLCFTKFKSPVFLGSSFAFLGSMFAAFAGAVSVNAGYMGLLLGAVFVGVACFIYKKNKTKNGALIASLAGAVAMALASLPFNYFVVYPVYYNFMPEETILAAYQVLIPSMKSIFQSLLCFNVPFTFIKGMIDVVITFLIYKHISPILKGKTNG